MSKWNDELINTFVFLEEELNQNHTLCDLFMLDKQTHVSVGKCSDSEELALYWATGKYLWLPVCNDKDIDKYYVSRLKRKHLSVVNSVSDLERKSRLLSDDFLDVVEPEIIPEEWIFRFTPEDTAVPTVPTVPTVPQAVPAVPQAVPPNVRDVPDVPDVPDVRDVPDVPPVSWTKIRATLSKADFTTKDIVNNTIFIRDGRKYKIYRTTSPKPKTWNMIRNSRTEDHMINLPFIRNGEIYVITRCE